MALTIETFSSDKGGASFFKALGHPLAAEQARELIARLRAAGPVAIYDPHSLAGAVAEIYDLTALDVAGVFVQSVEDIGANRLGQTAQPVTDLKAADARTVFVAAFDADRLIAHVRHLIPDGAIVESLDAIRLPDDMLTDPTRYLSPLNFATNFAFFRDLDGMHTRLVTANYWAGYGATGVSLWLRLHDRDGEALVDWDEPLPDGLGSVTIDSRAVRERFGLGPFEGQLFLHVVGAAGHDVVKYALDTYGDTEDELSCTHDANAWPADYYAGLPAPRDGERVILWVQNSHPCPIPAGTVALNPMGIDEPMTLDRNIPPFGSYPLDVAELVPKLSWPAQLEIRAGKHFVRPRYEVIGDKGRRRIAHANVERTDLNPDPKIADLANLMGKGYLLPAPVLPRAAWRSFVMPTPMSRSQANLPIAVVLHDANGREIDKHSFGRLDRAECVALEIDEMFNGASDLPSGYGHVELVYDFAEGGEADGWLHGLFRYEDRFSTHVAETSFGAHIFNTVMTYRSEPQSYAGPAPGLSTRLFLRLGDQPLETMCHLIYPASTPWHGASATDLVLYDGGGAEVARKKLEIPCSGSRLWRYTETFDDEERACAGDGAYIVIRDRTCRLFGYHGLLNDAGAFSFDHMFGF